MKVFQESWGLQVYAEGLMVIKNYRESVLEKAGEKTGYSAVPAHYVIIHSCQYFEQGYIFKLEAQSLSPNINKHTVQQPLPGSAIHPAHTFRGTR